MNSTGIIPVFVKSALGSGFVFEEMTDLKYSISGMTKISFSISFNYNNILQLWLLTDLTLSLTFMTFGHPNFFHQRPLYFPNSPSFIIPSTCPRRGTPGGEGILCKSYFHLLQKTRVSSTALRAKTKLKNNIPSRSATIGASSLAGSLDKDKDPRTRVQITKWLQIVYNLV